MRRAKRVAGLIAAGFIAFAPPGTLIFGALLVVGLLKDVPLAALAGACCLGAIALLWLLARRRRGRRPDGGAGRAAPKRFG